MMIKKTFIEKSHEHYLKLIHIAKAALCLSDDEYRSCVGYVSKGRATSSKALSLPECEALLAHFEALGWKRFNSPAAKQLGHLRIVPKRDKKIDFILKLWGRLKKIGYLKNNNRQALLAYCKRQTGRVINQLEDLTNDEKSLLIQALQAIHQRTSSAA